MIYYFFNNQILCFETKISEAIPEAESLTTEQAAFYEAHKTASIEEIKACELVEVVTYTPTYEDLRRNEYFTTQCVNWQDKMLTVEDANRLFMYYRAEGDETRALALQALIKVQKDIIRAKYPKPE